MKICESCGKEISDFGVYLDNGFTQCKACAESKAKKTHISNDKLKTANSIDLSSADFWTRFMKSLTIIQLFILIIGSLGLAYIIGEQLDSFGFAILAFIVLAVISIALCGFTMVFLNMAENIAIIKSFIRKNYIDKDNE